MLSQTSRKYRKQRHSRQAREMAKDKEYLNDKLKDMQRTEKSI